jgi:hypothetical protein
LASIAVGAWATFEALAGDLWVAAINTNPAGLAELKGTASRIERQSVGRAKKAAGDQENAVDTEKTVRLQDIHEVTRGTYDLSHKMGDVLRRRFKFTTLKGIREAYSVAFSEKEKHARTHAIDEALADKALDALNLVRNLIVHRAGVADRDYVNSTRGNSVAPQLQPGETLGLDAKELRNLIEPVTARCAELVHAVDRWVTLTGATHVTEQSAASPPGSQMRQV